MAVSATPILTFSIKEGFDSELAIGSVVVLGIGSPENLNVKGLSQEMLLYQRAKYTLVGHNHEITFSSIFVRLNLIVGRMYACSASQEDQKLGGIMRIVARLGDVNLVDVKDIRYCFFATWAHINICNFRYFLITSISINMLQTGQRRTHTT